jgi:rRNA maturation RNase YbeY
MQSEISLFFEDADLEFDQVDSVLSWIEDSVEREGRYCGELSFILCSDEYLRKLNKKYLDHDYYTDVITFDYSDNNGVSGDVFLSVDRVSDNAAIMKVDFTDELHRVMIHGVLHLCGYSDGSDDERNQMRAKEDYYLSLRTF